MGDGREWMEAGEGCRWISTLARSRMACGQEGWGSRLLLETGWTDSQIHKPPNVKPPKLISQTCDFQFQSADTNPALNIHAGAAGAPHRPLPPWGRVLTVGWVWSKASEGGVLFNQLKRVEDKEKRESFLLHDLRPHTKSYRGGHCIMMNTPLHPTYYVFSHCLSWLRGWPMQADTTFSIVTGVVLDFLCEF